MKRLAVLGSTGVIGGHTLDLVEEFPEKFSISALSAGENVDRLVEQIRKFRPRVVAVKTQDSARDIGRIFPGIEVLWGPEGLCQVATMSEVNMVIAGVVGFAGMQSTLAAIQAGKAIGLANKEAMITAGPLMVAALRENPEASVLPIDSEHNAIFQCLQGSRPEDLRKIILTCSGGPFRQSTREALKSVTAEQALKHPNWVMGRKITIDSATLMNKGLEMIEAKFLFNLRPDQISVVIHPQSVIHSMVEWKDGAVTASLGETTMRGPIAHVLAHPERLPGVLKPINWGHLHQLTFEEPDSEKFPSLKIADAVLSRGGNSPVIMNAANEIAVENFLSHRLSFLEIFDVIDCALQTLPWEDLNSSEQVIEWDRQAREVASRFVANRSPRN